MWNAITTNDNGNTWRPYIEVATFDLNNNTNYERKYPIVDQYRPWLFSSAIPSANGTLGTIAYYVTNESENPSTKPFLDLAFGILNTTNNKWEMMSVLNSTASLPVQDERLSADYNFGDFLTIRKHPNPTDGYRWDAGGYVVVGEHYYSIEPFFMMIR